MTYQTSVYSSLGWRRTADRRASHADLVLVQSQSIERALAPLPWITQNQESRGIGQH